MKKNTEIISFVNNKGGSGKSTTCCNIAYSLSVMGKKVLVIDGDMQLNLSLSFFNEEKVLDIAKSNKNLFYAIKNSENLSNYIIPTEYKNLDIIPSSTLMSTIEYELFTKWQRELILKKCISEVKEAKIYDYILIDSPPTIGGWVMNILCASDKLIIPVEASPWGLFGLSNLFQFFNDVKSINTNLQLSGIIITKVDERKNYFKQTFDSLKELNGIYTFLNYIKVDSTLEWSQENNMPVMAYKKSCRSAKEYYELSKEVDLVVAGKRKYKQSK